MRSAGSAGAVGFTLAGYFAGKSYERVISAAGKASTFIIVLVVVVVAALVIWRKVHEHRRADPQDEKTGEHGSDGQSAEPP